MDRDSRDQENQMSVTTLVFPGGCVTDENMDALPRIGEKIGSFIVADVKAEGPGDEIDTATWVYLLKAEK
jgi:hypothetical protein